MRCCVKFIILFSLVIILLACQSTVIYTNQNKPVPETLNKNSKTKVNQPSSHLNISETGKSEYMVASWYGNQYHGKKTANGETFNMYDYTAAHRSLPFGTRLKLINEVNNKEAVVRINDRGPVPLERDIDVSYKTAEDLDFLDVGLAKLKVIYLK